jgi:transcriptional regulator GlxA family with amidase domain
MRVAILTVEGMFDSGLTVILDIMATANALSGQAELPAPPFDVIPAGRGASVQTAHGLRLATTPWAQLRDDPPELAVMPAVGLRPPAEVVGIVRDNAILAPITALHENGTGMAAACSGTFFLAEAGILDGLTATTSWWLGSAFRARYPKVDLDQSRTLAITGNITTAGAAFAHMDLALSLVHQQSPALAELVARYLVIGDRPSQAAVAVPSLLARGHPTVAAFERYVREHLSDPIGVKDAARALGVSERTLQRATVATIGMSPVRFIQEIRLEQATFLLRSTNQTADAIAAAVGYQDAGTLRSLVRRRRRTTLGALRPSQSART